MKHGFVPCCGSVAAESGPPPQTCPVSSIIRLLHSHFDRSFPHVKTKHNPSTLYQREFPLEEASRCSGAPGLICSEFARTPFGKVPSRGCSSVGPAFLVFGDPNITVPRQIFSGLVWSPLISPYFSAAPSLWCVPRTCFRRSHPHYTHDVVCPLLRVVHVATRQKAV